MWRRLHVELTARMAQVLKILQWWRIHVIAVHACPVLYVCISYWLRHYATSRKVTVLILMRSLDIWIYLILSAALDPGVYSAHNRNKSQKIVLGGKGRLAGLRHITTLWASTAWYKVSFTHTHARTHAHVYKARSRGPGVQPWGSIVLTTQHPLSMGVGTGFDDKQRSIGWYSSLADWGHRVWLF
jgi:hypothetical protein